MPKYYRVESFLVQFDAVFRLVGDEWSVLPGGLASQARSVSPELAAWLNVTPSKTLLEGFSPADVQAE